jgi:hypothetical protein
MAIEIRPMILNTSSDWVMAAAGSSTWPPMVSVEAMAAIQPPNRLAMARAMYQTAITNETIDSGDSLVICDRPTGDMNISPEVCSMYMTTRKISGMRNAPSAKWAPISRIRKPAPTWISDRPNLTIGPGLRPRLPSTVQRAANTGAKIRIQPALIAWVWAALNEVLTHSLPAVLQPAAASCSGEPSTTAPPNHCTGCDSRSG